MILEKIMDMITDSQGCGCCTTGAPSDNEIEAAIKKYSDERLTLAKEALESIVEDRYGLDLSDDDSTQLEYWAALCAEYRAEARKALAQLEREGG